MRATKSSKYLLSPLNETSTRAGRTVRLRGADVEGEIEEIRIQV